MSTPQPAIDPAVFVRLADEGVPIRVIARCTKAPADQIREAVKDAVLSGTILKSSVEEWPAGGNREIRVPAWVKDGNTLEAELVYNCIRLFKITKLQASLLAVLLSRTEGTKEAMHCAIEGCRSSHKDETDPKMVDVVICHLRKRLAPFGLVIHTLWARGYYIEPAQRKFVMELVEKYVMGTFTPDDLKLMPAATEGEKKSRGKPADQ